MVKGFKEHDDITALLQTPTNLGHYVADVSLHFIQNNNDQLTHQNGIHTLQESRIPKLFSDQHNYCVGKARYIAPLNEAFKICHA